MAGEAIWALAWAEGRSRYDFNTIATTAKRQGENYVLSGTKAAVIGAPWADKLIVSARTSGGPRDRGGISLFVVDRHSANLHLQGFKTIDGRRAAELTLMNVQVPASQLLGNGRRGRHRAGSLPRPRHRRALRRSGRRDDRIECGDARIQQDAQAVRCRDRHRSRCCSTAWSTCSSRCRRRSR